MFKKIDILALIIPLFILLTACSNVKRNQEMSVSQQTTTRCLTLVGYNHPILRQVMRPVTFPLSAQDKQIINDMKYSIQPEQLKTAKAPWDAAVGMAANQWGLNKRIFLFCPEGDPINGLEVIINPSYENITDVTTNLPQQDLKWEGCFSVPLAIGNVQRHLHIRVTYQNEDGKTISKELHGWPARVWQHENDHLNGLLYDDHSAGKCIEKKQFSTKAEVEKFYADKICPCGKDKHYKDCCGMYHTQEKFPSTPEELMRSRYSAFVKKDIDYIKHTMRGPALAKFNQQGATVDNPEEWLGLTVVKAYYDPNPDVGYVEFIAKYKLNGTESHIHELSKFMREQEHWYYVEGEHLL